MSDAQPGEGTEAQAVSQIQPDGTRAEVDPSAQESATTPVGVEGTQIGPDGTRVAVDTGEDAPAADEAKATPEPEPEPEAKAEAKHEAKPEHRAHEAKAKD